jgi:tetratricopeptide (TPR) repeat protein
LLYLGQVLLRRDRIDEARRALALVAEDLEVARARAAQDSNLVGQLGRIHYQLAQALLEMGDHSGAARVAAEVPRLIPRAWKPCLDTAKLIARCADAIQNDSSVPAKERQQQAERYTRQARDLLDVAASRGGDDYHVQDDLIWTLAGNGGRALLDRDRAIALARRMTERLPKNPDTWYTLGAALYKNGRWTESLESLRKSMALRKGGDAYDWYYVAMVQHQLGKPSQARLAYRRGVQWQASNRSDSEMEGLRAEAARVLGVRNLLEEYLRRDGRQLPARPINIAALIADR